jgi:hypothetical protein
MMTREAEARIADVEINKALVRNLGQKPGRWAILMRARVLTIRCTNIIMTDGLVLLLALIVIIIIEAVRTC